MTKTRSSTTRADEMPARPATGMGAAAVPRSTNSVVMFILFCWVRLEFCCARARHDYFATSEPQALPVRIDVLRATVRRVGFSARNDLQPWHTLKERDPPSRLVRSWPASCRRSGVENEIRGDRSSNSAFGDAVIGASIGRVAFDTSPASTLPPAPVSKERRRPRARSAFEELSAMHRAGPGRHILVGNLRIIPNTGPPLVSNEVLVPQDRVRHHCRVQVGAYFDDDAAREATNPAVTVGERGSLLSL